MTTVTLVLGLILPLAFIVWLGWRFPRVALLLELLSLGSCAP